MDFNLSEEQLALKKEMIKFAQNELNDELIRRDKESLFSKEHWKKMCRVWCAGAAVSTGIWGA